MTKKKMEEKKPKKVQIKKKEKKTEKGEKTEKKGMKEEEDVIKKSGLEVEIIPLNMDRTPENRIKKDMKLDIMYFPKRIDRMSPYERMSPFKMFDLFRSINKIDNVPMSVERMTYEEIKRTNMLLREILNMIRPKKGY